MRFSDFDSLMCEASFVRLGLWAMSCAYCQFCSLQVRKLVTTKWDCRQAIRPSLYASARLLHLQSYKILTGSHTTLSIVLREPVSLRSLRERRIKMSDFEDDEMDVDGPAVQEAIHFSSDNTNTKGKRSAANLPVEAEDSLPWYGPMRSFNSRCLLYW